jgi:hypothetical protein
MGADQSLDDRDTAILAHGSESLADTPSSAPSSESFVAELHALVGDQVTGVRSRLMNQSSQETPDSHRRGLLFEDCEPHNAPRVVINGHGDPSAERPALR